MDKIIKNKIKTIGLIFFLSCINFIALLKMNYKCPWKSLLNIDCAGCGGTRMFIAILNLEFYQAFRYNPLVFLLLICLIVYFIYIIICKLFRIKYFKFNTNHLWGLLFLVIIFMILRNMSIFDYLKPTVIS